MARALSQDLRDRHLVEVLRSSRDHTQKKALLSEVEGTGHAIEQDCPDVLSRRRAWFDGQLDLEPERLVFIDETWTATNVLLGRDCSGLGRVFTIAELTSELREISLAKAR